jgi:hypothetical protein
VSEIAEGLYLEAFFSGLSKSRTEKKNMRDLLLLASKQLQEMNGRQVELKPVSVVESIS